jgi:hypothetical protein
MFTYSQINLYLDEQTTIEEDDKVSLATLTQLDTSSIDGETSSISDGRCITLMHRVSVVEKHMEDIQAKLFLCKQDTKSLASGRGTVYKVIIYTIYITDISSILVSNFSLKRISKRFSHIDENMSSLLRQWEESKHSLNSLLDDEQLKLKTPFASLPSPPSSPRDFRQNVYSADEESNASLMSHMSINRNKTTHV